MASMRADIVLNSGPSVSDLRNDSRSRYACNVKGSYISTHARGFSSRLRRVLLKNWQDNATWCSST
jgi:hypothetical protein